MWNNLYFKFMNLMQDEEGLGTLEIILIIVVLIGLVVVFKKQITALVNNVLKKITSSANSI